MDRVFGPPKNQQSPTLSQPQPHLHTKPNPPLPPSIQEQQKRMQLRIQELTSSLNSVDNNLKALYEKSQSVTGTPRQTCRQRCLQLLKKRKQYQQQIRNLTSQQYALNQIAFTKQCAQDEIEMQKLIKQAKAELEKQKRSGTGNFDEFRDEIEKRAEETDSMDDWLDINNILNIDDINDDDLEGQFQELEAEYNRKIKSGNHGVNKQESHDIQNEQKMKPSFHNLN